MSILDDPTFNIEAFNKFELKNNILCIPCLDSYNIAPDNKSVITCTHPHNKLKNIYCKKKIPT
jgi:hypothetical protein